MAKKDIKMILASTRTHTDIHKMEANQRHDMRRSVLAYSALEGTTTNGQHKVSLSS